MSVAPAPVVRDVLAGHLGMVRLPARTTALLERAGEGFGAIEFQTVSRSGILAPRAESGPGAPAFQLVSEPGAINSPVASGPGTIESRAVDLLADRLAGLLDGLCDTPEHADLVMPVRALSGLGPGLTPTGDDLLVGIAAACHRLVAGGYWSAVRRDALVAALAGMGDTGTTTVAREMVGEAAAGRFPEVLASFVELLGDRDTVADQVQAAAGRLAAIGAHSGADMLAGVIAVAARACREGTTR